MNNFVTFEPEINWKTGGVRDAPPSKYPLRLHEWKALKFTRMIMKDEIPFRYEENLIQENESDYKSKEGELLIKIFY